MTISADAIIASMQASMASAVRADRPYKNWQLKKCLPDDAADAIKTMRTRGAPLIGAVAAFGLCLALRADASDAAMERDAALLAEELEQVRALQQAQEKDALALDHEQRKLVEEFARTNARLSAARSELEKLTRRDQETRAQREQRHLLLAEKEQARFDQDKAVESARSEFDVLQAQAHSVNEEYSTLRAAVAGFEERVRAEKTAAARMEMQVRLLATRKENLVRDLERMGTDRARLLADNITLDQRAQELAEQTA